MKHKVNKGFYWHVHHDVPMEYCYDYDERVKFIKGNKPEHEIKTRLRLFQPVEGDLPEELVKTGGKYCEAREKYNEAWEKYDEAREKYEKAWEKYDEAWKRCKKARKKYDEAWEKYCEACEKYKDFITDLHDKECGCSEWNGKRIVFKEEE